MMLTTLAIFNMAVTEFGGEGAVLYTLKYTELENISWVVLATKKGLSVVPLLVLIGLMHEVCLPLVLSTQSKDLNSKGDQA